MDVLYEFDGDGELDDPPPYDGEGDFDDDDEDFPPPDDDPFLSSSMLCSTITTPLSAETSRAGELTANNTAASETLTRIFLTTCTAIELLKFIAPALFML